MGRKRKGVIRYRGISSLWNARFGVLHSRLSKSSAKLFAEMSLKKKKIVIEKLIKKGLLR